MRHEPACDAVLDHVESASVRASNDRFPMSHGLQKYQAKTFPAAGESEYIAVRVARKEFILRQILQKTNVFRNAQIASELFESWAVITSANEDKENIR